MSRNDTPTPASLQDEGRAQDEGRVQEEARVKDAARVSRRTTLGLVIENLCDEPSSGLSAWARTTAGVVALLFGLQLLTGVLLAFYYVPSAESAYVTVAYVEKVVGAGSWVRALHFYCSQLLPAALVLHLAQSLWRGAYARRPVGWAASVLLLGLSLANGATGYSLPWDARAFFSTRVAENVTGGLPLVGETLRTWLVGGAEISTLTLSRFFALHALVVPAVLLAVCCARLFVLREPDAPTPEPRPRANPYRLRKQLARNAVAAALVFTALALYASKYPAPLGPSVEAAPPGYLPRPGAQFVWLFQLLKLFPRTIASLVAFLLPALLLAALALLPFTRSGAPVPQTNTRRRRLGQAMLTAATLLVVTLTAVAYLQDARDQRLREQFVRQSQREAEFRATPFTPRRVPAGNSASEAQTASPSSANPAPSGAAAIAEPPQAFQRNCAKCHGAHGEGKSVNPSLIGISTHPRRTLDDIIAILNNPAAYGLESRMPSFARKLSEDEKRELAAWIVSLK
ncbi:MAG: ubiquinol-cytochrome c reductase cytochrome b subunit [Acidobacteriota bacterium]|nr:ubiquinol-cytochrome c reductase cytochrome b subunit [Acidobacteriota bacterium]